MSNHLIRILCLIAFMALYGCSSGSSEGGVSGTGGPPKISVNGQVEKGPFLKRSTVTYRYINEQGETLSGDVSTETTDDLGSFSLGLNKPGLIKIRASGYQFNEVTGQISDGTLALNALYIAEDEEEQSARVNLLTHIIHDRALNLIESGSVSAGLALTQAEQELLTELDAIIPKVSANDFNQFSIYNRQNTNEDGNTYLLLFSAALYQHAINATPELGSLSGSLTSILNRLTDDFVDGDLEASSDLLNGLVLAIQQLEPEQIISNLENRSAEVLGEVLEVPNFSDFIGQFLITYPAEDATLSEVTPIRLEVPSGLQNVTLDLLVDGLVVNTITEAPFEFTWDPYYWSSSSTSRHTLLVKASNTSGAEIVSNLVSVSVLPNSNNQLNLTSPSDSQVFANSNSTSLQWELYEGSAQYKVQVADSSSFTNVLFETTTSSNQFDLEELVVGNYYWRLQAADEEERAGTWTEPMSFRIQAPQPPNLQLPSFGTVIRNTATPALSWSAVENAASYQLQIATLNDFESFVVIENLTDDSFTPPPLEAGNYFWRIKSIDGVGHESGYSSTNAFVIDGPLPPENITSEWRSSDDEYEVTLNWQAAAYANAYDIQISSDDTFSSGGTSINVDSETGITNLAIGEYYGRVRSINVDGIAGDWSGSIAISVGLFRTQLGGIGNDSAKQIISSRQGGYLILGVSGVDDWVVRLNEQGDIVGEYIDSASNGNSIADIYEAEDGSVFLVGRDGDNSNKAVAIKLTSELAEVWQVEYRPESVAERYDFNKIIEWNSELYILAVQFHMDGSNSRVDRLQLHTINNVTGIISAPENLSVPADLVLLSADDLLVSSAGNLVVAGNVRSAEYVEDYYYDSVGAYMLRLNSDIETLSWWDNIGEYLHIGMDAALELENGKYAILGYDVSTAPVMSYIESDGLTEYRNYQTPDFGSDLQGLTAGWDSNGSSGIYSLLKGAEFGGLSWPMLLVEYSQDAIEIDRHYFLDEPGFSRGEALLRNPDGSIILLFEQRLDDDSNFDVVIRRFSP